jgi:simple sugar transport system permease protein
MSATTQTPETVAASAPPRKFPRLQVIVTSIAVLGSLLFIYLAPADEKTKFRFSLETEKYQFPLWVVEARTGAMIFGAISILLALATWLTRKYKKTTFILVGLSMFSLLMALFSWVAAGKPTIVPVTGLLQGSVLLAVPLIFGAMSGVLSERSGVININIEGQLLLGAFMAAVVASLAHNAYAGLLAAPLGGLFLGLLLAMFATKYFVDQVVVGVVLNVLAVGLTSFLYGVLLAPKQDQWNTPPVFQSINIPILSKIPFIGPIFFQQTIVVYIMYIVVIGVQFYLFHTRWGLRVRSVGEYPAAADSVGIKVNRTRFRTVLIASAIAGLGGAYFTVGATGPFQKEMTSGKGFIALAAVIFGRWTPLGALGAALLFGFADQLQNVLSIIGTPIPSQFLLMAPYVITILAVAGLVGKVRAPGADGIPFKK